MKKILFVFLLCAVSLCTYAQDSIRFVLQPSGDLLTEDNQDYKVIECPGKTASELFKMVKANAISLYNDPDKVMSESTDEMINIYAYEDCMCIVSSLGAKGMYGGHYKLVFRFKDGKIRVDAPLLERTWSLSGGFMTNTVGIPSSVSLSSYAKKVCKGNSKKNKGKKEHIENVVNWPIRYLLGLEKTNKKNDNEDW